MTQRCHTCWNLHRFCTCADRLLAEAFADADLHPDTAFPTFWDEILRTWNGILGFTDDD